MSSLSTGKPPLDVPNNNEPAESVSEIVSDYLHTMLDTAFSVPQEQLPASKAEAPLVPVAVSPSVVKPRLNGSSSPPATALKEQAPEIVVDKIDDEPIQEPPPPWETEELEWLLVTAGRLNLAFPLIGLDSVQSFDKKVTPFSSSMGWLPGLTRIKSSNIRLVDVASYLMHDPPDYSKAENILVLNNSSWGLLVDRIVNTKKITQDQMRRPSTTGRYSWRFGALIDPVYTLIDPLRLAEALEDSITKSD